MQNLAENGGSILGIGLLVVLGFYAVGALVSSFIIRLAVRHGTLDAWRRLLGGPGSPRDPSSASHS